MLINNDGPPRFAFRLLLLFLLFHITLLYYALLFCITLTSILLLHAILFYIMRYYRTQNDQIELTTSRSMNVKISASSSLHGFCSLATSYRPQTLFAGTALSAKVKQILSLRKFKNVASGNVSRRRKFPDDVFKRKSRLALQTTRKRINVPIIFGYARLRLFIMSTNSFRDLDNLGLKAFSSATVVTVLPE